MELKNLNISIDKTSRQRNLFLGLALVLAGSNLLTGIRLASFDQKIIMVPGLQSEMWVSSNKVSTSYLEQMSLVFLSSLLDISAHDVKHKRDLVLRNTSNSDANYSKQVNSYFESVEKEYTQFDLATHFTVKNITIDKMTATANGVLTSWYGKKGFETKEVSYILSFELVGGFLKLKTFERVVEEDNKQDKDKKG